VKSAWIAVACAEHVRRGREGGFMQVCHGRKPRSGACGPAMGSSITPRPSPLAARSDTGPSRLPVSRSPASPTHSTWGAGFRPWRRNVRWHAAGEIRVASVLDRLGFATGRRNWAYGLRFGLMAIPPEDFGVILLAMTSIPHGEETSGGSYMRLTMNAVTARHPTP